LRIAKSFDYSVAFLAFVAGFIIVFAMLSVSAEVAIRYIFNSSIEWVTEVVEYCLLCITFFGAAWVLKGEGHIKMDLVLNRLKPKHQALVNVITSTIATVVCLVLTWYGAVITLEHYQTGYIITSPLEPPIWPIIAVIPLGLFMFSIQFLIRSYGFLGTWRALSDEDQNSL